MLKPQIRHALIQDLKRVASDLGRIPTELEYHAAPGAFSKDTVQMVFKTFCVLKSASGLKVKRSEQSPQEKRELRLVTKYESRLRIAEAFKLDVLAWAGKYEVPQDEQILVGMWRSDDHSIFVDPWCDKIFWDVARRMKPNILIFGGDTVDFPDVSKFSQDPTRKGRLQEEIDFVVQNFFSKAREILPHAQIDWILGNHEMRLFRFLCDVAPALTSLRNLQFGKLFELDRFQINLVARENFLTEKATGYNFKEYYGIFAGTHGVKLGPHPSQKELATYGKNGLSGHVHRFTNFTRRDLWGYHRWISAPAMCQLTLGESFIPDLIDWTQGFVNFYLDLKRKAVYFEPVDLTPGFACIGGVYYWR